MADAPGTTRLGTDGPIVSRLCLGTMMFGGATDESEAIEIIDAFGEAGGTFLDTADTYNGGASERVVGKAVARDRARWTVATKLGNPVAGVDGSGGLSRRWVREAIAMSLDRMKLDRIDILYLHLDDEATPMEETLGALGEALAAGTVAAWGFSNYRAWKIAELVHVADRLGIAPPVVCQPYYHVLYRVAEIDTLPACRHFGIGVVPYSPLARGVLTGKYAAGVPEGSRAARGDERIQETEMRPELLAAAEKVVAHARATDRDPAGFALAWVLGNPIVSSVLVGPRTMEQMLAYLEGARTPMLPGDEAAVNAVVAPGCAAGTNYSDPRYPYRGRPVEEAA